MSSQSSPPDVVITTKSKEKEETRTRRVPPYNVILENDDHHSFDFVVEVLRKALGYSQERAHQLTVQAETSGRAVVWTGPQEVAELKADQIRTFHETRPPGSFGGPRGGPDGADLGPLGCTLEPAPGG